MVDMFVFLLVIVMISHSTEGFLFLAGELQTWETLSNSEFNNRNEKVS